jgi:hypothetical protein
MYYRFPLILHQGVCKIGRLHIKETHCFWWDKKESFFDILMNLSLERHEKFGGKLK